MTINKPSDYESVETLDVNVKRELRAVARDSSITWRGVRQAMLEAANRLRQETGQRELPVGLDGAKRLRRICSESWFDSAKARVDAILVPTNLGFTLRLKKGQARVRIRFNIAHEIGHTFFYDISKSPPVRLITSDSPSIISRREEEICSAFARELIMPRELVLRRVNDVRNVGGGPGLLLYLGLQFDVSPEVVTRRLLHDLSLFPTSIVLFREETLTNGACRTRFSSFKGSSIASLRKREADVYAKVKLAMKGTPPWVSLEQLRDCYSDIVALQWRWDATDRNTRLIVWLNFKRDGMLESVLLTPKDTLRQSPSIKARV